MSITVQCEINNRQIIYLDTRYAPFSDREALDVAFRTLERVMGEAPCEIRLMIAVTSGQRLVLTGQCSKE